jgi:hypothetical protein
MLVRDMSCADKRLIVFFLPLLFLKRTMRISSVARASLKNSLTHANLKAAFAGESQANRRYLYFAQKADVEGLSEVAAVFRSAAEGETGLC